MFIKTCALLKILTMLKARAQIEEFITDELTIVPIKVASTEELEKTIQELERIAFENTKVIQDLIFERISELTTKLKLDNI
jgi:hypothetical protein